MAGSRYNLVQKPHWQYLGPAYQGLDQDVSAIEDALAAGGGAGGTVAAAAPVAGLAGQARASTLTTTAALAGASVAQTPGTHDPALSRGSMTSDLYTSGQAVVTGAQVQVQATYLRGQSPRNSGAVPSSLTFGFNGAAFEVDIAGQEPVITWFTVWADGQYVGAFPGNPGANDGREMFVKVTLPDARARTITITSGGAWVYAIYSATSASITSPVMRTRPRVVVASDSFGEGTGASGGRGFVELLPHLVAADDIRQGAAGGSGYVVNGPGDHVKLADRMAADVTGHNPDIVVCALGYNDSSQTPGVVATAARAAWTAIRNAGAQILIIGPWDARNTAEDRAIDDALAAAAATDGLPYVSPIREGWLKANLSLLIADEAHPNDAGHAIIAGRIASYLTSMLPVMTTSSSAVGQGLTRVVYVTGVGWPARPSSGMIDWVDPTGSATAPAMQPGDTFTQADNPAASAAPVELLSVGQSALTVDWFTSTGAPTIDLVAGTISLNATVDKAGLANIPCGPNVQLTLTATPTPETASEVYVLDLDFWTAANGYISSSYHVSTAGPLTVTTPATTDHVSIILQGQDGQSVVIDTVNLKRPAA